MRYCEETFQSDSISTIGVDFKIKRIELEGCNQHLAYRRTGKVSQHHQEFLQGSLRSCTDILNQDPNSFSHIESWIGQIREVGSSDTNIVLVVISAT